MINDQWPVNVQCPMHGGLDAVLSGGRAVAGACPKTNSSPTLSLTLSMHFVQNWRKWTKCFDKVSDKVAKSRVPGRAASPLVISSFVIGHSLVIGHYPFGIDWIEPRLIHQAQRCIMEFA